MAENKRLLVDEDRLPTGTIDLSGELPSGRSSRQHVYVVVLSGQRAGAVFRLGDAATIIGRSPRCSLQLTDHGVSREHARLSRQGPVIRLVDMGSTNGTFVDTKRVDKATLHDGDRFEIGGTLLKVYFGDELEASLQRELYESAQRDWLTGLHNRRFFEERLVSEFAFARRHRVSLALVLLDLDDFEKINAQQGRRVGDDALQDVAEAIRYTTRQEDTVTRFSGEAFAVLARQTSPTQARRLAERIRAVVEKLKARADRSVGKVTVSGGIACLNPTIYETPEELVESAERALSQAKLEGKNRIICLEDVIESSPPEG